MSKQDVIVSIIREELERKTLDKIVFSRPHRKDVKKAVAKLFQKEQYIGYTPHNPYFDRAGELMAAMGNG